MKWKGHAFKMLLILTGCIMTGTSIVLAIPFSTVFMIYVGWLQADYPDPSGRNKLAGVSVSSLQVARDGSLVAVLLGSGVFLITVGVKKNRSQSDD